MFENLSKKSVKHPNQLNILRVKVWCQIAFASMIFRWWIAHTHILWYFASSASRIVQWNCTTYLNIEGYSKMHTNTHWLPSHFDFGIRVWPGPMSKLFFLHLSPLLSDLTLNDKMLLVEWFHSEMTNKREILLSKIGIIQFAMVFTVQCSHLMCKPLEISLCWCGAFYLQL